MKKVVFREEIEKNILCFREKSAVYISVFRDIIKKNMEKGGCIWFLSVKYTISFCNGKNYRPGHLQYCWREQGVLEKVRS